MKLDMIGADMMEQICSYLKVEYVANLEQTCKKINSEIERTNIWKKLANRLLKKFQYTFLQDAYKSVQDSPEQHTEKHCSKWIISLVLITHNTFKEVQAEQLLEDNFCDPNFDVSDSDDEYDVEHYERGVAFYKTNEAIKISRGDTIALKSNAFFVVDEEPDDCEIPSIELSLSPNFYGLYAAWLKEYVELKDDILETEQDFLWSTI
jgi:hypothetical protein